MKDRVIDISGILAVGLLLTAILTVVLFSLPYLEDSFLFSPATHWWNIYIVRDKICLFILPVLAAFLCAKRTGFNPFLAGIATCLIPALAYFVFRYTINVLTKLEMEREPGLWHVMGYVDPHDLAQIFRMAVKPCVWALVTGSGGGAIHFLMKRKVASNNSMQATPNGAPDA